MNEANSAVPAPESDDLDRLEALYLDADVAALQGKRDELREMSNVAFGLSCWLSARGDAGHAGQAIWLAWRLEEMTDDARDNLVAALVRRGRKGRSA